MKNKKPFWMKFLDFLLDYESIKEERDYWKEKYFELKKEVKK